MDKNEFITKAKEFQYSDKEIDELLKLHEETELMTGENNDYSLEYTCLHEKINY